MRNSSATVFVAGLIASLSFWWGINILSEDLEHRFYAMASQQEGVFAATALSDQLHSQLRETLPVKRSDQGPELSASAALSLLVKEDGTRRVLYDKNSDEPVLIASVSKLMTAYVGALHFPKGDIHELFYPLLIESNNDAAKEIASRIGRGEFVALMNLEAQRLGLKSTSFVNPTGLDSDTGEGNRANAQDTARLLEAVREDTPGLFSILSLKEYGGQEEVIFSTNQLLSDQSFPLEILGGKTGETPLAKQALVIMTETPTGKGYLVHAVLGSEDRFQDMRKLVDWIVSTHTWTL